MTATRIRCTSPADLIAHVTELLGYCPSDSLLILPLTGDSGGATLRLDLPAATAPPDALERYAGTALGYAMHVETTDAVLCLVFVDEAVAMSPRRDLIAALDEVAARMGLHMFTPLYRARNGWGSYRSLRGVEPHKVRSLEELGASAALLPSAPPRAGLDSSDESIEICHDASPVGEIDSATIIDRLLESDRVRLHPDEADEVFGVLAQTLSFRALRDELLARIAFGTAADAALASMRGHVLLGEDAERFDAHSLAHAFDPDRCERALPILRETARRVPREQRGMILSSLAWVCWSLGQGTLTAAWADRSLQVDANNDLARLLLAAANAGVVAPWFGKAPRRVRAPHDAA